MAACPDAILRLIEHFERQTDQVCSPEYNETQLRIDFVNPMFAELGWDMDNALGYAEQYREVVHEDRIKVAGATKAPDYSFRVGGNRKFFLEAKKPAVNIKDSWEPAYQLRRYAWSAKLAVSILTDFEELAIYDCRIQPKQFDKASVARREYIGYKQYPERWDFIAGTFSKDAVLRGDFDRYCGSARGRGAQEFDQAFLEEIEEWRKKLASNLALRNEGLDDRGLNFAVQRIIDRIVFLRICEDRGIEHVGQLRGLLNGEQIYARLLKLFRDADDRYNSGIFHFKTEKGRDEAPDELTPGLEVDDSTLKLILRRLYYPESPYEFTVVSADILGSVYERFLGKVITLTAGHRAKVEEKPEVRKTGGVYYTPTYIVDYIVQHTVGRLLEGKTPKEAAKLKVLDPACGSGSFLIGAYQHLLDWHLKWYVANGPESWAKGKNATLRPNSLGQWRLTIKERKRILVDNIHGVDIDYQAIEVTKLSLLLKVLEGETAESLGGFWSLFRERALPDLGRNVQCGNSLIGMDFTLTVAWKEMSDAEQQRVNVFDFRRAFPSVPKRGFDAVIGNPPYIRMEWFAPLKTYLAANYQAHEERADLYAYFLERALKLVNPNGLVGEIVSNKFIRAKYGALLRAALHEYGRVVAVVDFAGANVFHGATVRTVVLILEPKSATPASVATYVPPPRPDVMADLESGQTTVDRYAKGHALVVPADAFDPAEWKLTSTGNADLVRRLRHDGIPLHEFIGNRVLFGLKTGCNEAFIINEDEANRIDPKHKVVLPILFGKDVRRYEPLFAGRYVVYLHPDLNVEDFPRAGKHLAPYQKRLENRAGGQHWWELQQPAVNLLRFRKEPKIIYPIIAKECRFALDDGGYLVNDKTFILPTADLLVLGVLNSRVANFYFGEVCAALEGERDRYLEFRAQYVDLYPMPHAENSGPVAQRLRAAVTSMLRLRERQRSAKLPHPKDQLRRQIDETDRQIDHLVYELYGLTDYEIRIVEEATNGQ
jgi:hypothetical protein